MTTPLGIRGLTFRLTDLQPSDLTVFLQIVTGLDDIAAVRGIDTVVPGLTGRIPRARVKDVLPIELAGLVMGAGDTEILRRASYRTTVAMLQVLFDPSLAPGDLVVEAEDGTTYTIAARPISMVWGTEDVPCVRELSVALESVDPDWTVA